MTWLMKHPILSGMLVVLVPLVLAPPFMWAFGFLLQPLGQILIWWFRYWLR